MVSKEATVVTSVHNNGDLASRGAVPEFERFEQDGDRVLRLLLGLDRQPTQLSQTVFDHQIRGYQPLYFDPVVGCRRKTQEDSAQERKAEKIIIIITTRKIIIK